MSIHRRPEYIARDFFHRRGVHPILQNQVLRGTRYRPDFLFESSDKSTAIVVECDEPYHRTQNQSMEIHREHGIAKHLETMGYDSVTIIRFETCSVRRLTTQLDTVVNIVKSIMDAGQCPTRDNIEIDDRRRLFTKIIVR